jgi:hypothetical protein
MIAHSIAEGDFEFFQCSRCLEGTIALVELASIFDEGVKIHDPCGA